MQYISYYESPLGKMLLAADEIGLTGVWFDAQKYFACCLDEAYEEKEIPLFADVKKWFDVYFSGKEPDILIPLHLIGTKFQMEVRFLMGKQRLTERLPGRSLSKEESGQCLHRLWEELLGTIRFL